MLDNNSKNKYRKVIRKKKFENKNAKTELARDGLKNMETRPNGKVIRKQDEKGNMKLRTIFVE